MTEPKAQKIKPEPLYVWAESVGMFIQMVRDPKDFRKCEKKHEQNILSNAVSNSMASLGGKTRERLKKKLDAIKATKSAVQINNVKLN